jgi:hypothetical protein
MSLSDKKLIPFDCVPDGKSFYFFKEEDVKEHIKLLKEQLFQIGVNGCMMKQLSIIEEIFGSKLT